MPLLGPALGPILGGLITQHAGWRWLFHTMTFFTFILVLLAFLFLCESYPPIILERKAAQLRKTTSTLYHVELSQRNEMSRTRYIMVSLIRPIHFLVTEPILQYMSICLMVNFGTLYVVLSSFASMWQSPDYYNQSTSQAGLHYIALVTGYTIACQIGNPITDRIWATFKAKAGGETRPEYRVPLMIPGVVLLPAGLFWFGWSAQHHCHWILTDIGAAVFGCGTILSTQAMQAYLMDAFPKYTASAVAGSQMLRSIAGFSFPLFAPRLYHQLGLGWGNSVLGLVSAVLGIPVPLVLWYFGEKLRAKGRQR